MRHLLTMTLTSVLLTSCVHQPERSIPVFPVDGQLFIDGQPGIGASIEFHPLSRLSSENYFLCSVREDGHFVPTQKDGAIGLPAGRYRLVIRQPNGSFGDRDGSDVELPKSMQEIEVKETVNLLPPIKIQRARQPR